MPTHLMSKNPEQVKTVEVLRIRGEYLAIDTLGVRQLTGLVVSDRRLEKLRFGHDKADFSIEYLGMQSARLVALQSLSGSRPSQ